LILEAVRIGRLRARNSAEYALRDLILLHVSKATSVPTQITLPQSSTALRVAQAIVSNPNLPSPLKSLCAEAGIGVRTLQRTFQKEVGIDFASWRQQVRLTRAIELLTSGASVKEAAFAVGYRQPSAFVQIFRRHFGLTPKVWIDSLEPHRSSSKL
jgi:AraC-like DNA-binding protein